MIDVCFFHFLLLLASDFRRLEFCFSPLTEPMGASYNGLDELKNDPIFLWKGGPILEHLLAPLVGDASPVTVIGLCKNAGKTTAMRRLMAELGDERLALTSVGRDGERTDLVTGTEKPDLYLKAGDLFATARGMITLCDATLEVVDLTDVMTPLGPVAIFRTLSDGYVQLAGPSAAGQLRPLTARFMELGAQRVLIDGAAGRKSLAGAGVEGVALLCTGASLDRDMDLVVSETAHTCWLFVRKVPEHAGLRSALEGVEDRFALFELDGGGPLRPIRAGRHPSGAAPGRRRQSQVEQAASPPSGGVGSGRGYRPPAQNPGPPGRSHYPGHSGRHPPAGRPGRPGAVPAQRRPTGCPPGADHRRCGGQPLVCLRLAL